MGGPTSTELTWVDASAEADVPRAVRAQLKRAADAGQTLLVYVGAAWCEPCQVFHEAAVSGRLHEPLKQLRVLAFDLDRDRDKLAAAGYVSRMIPLFAVPAADGRAAGPQVAGAVKGQEAIDYLVPRLQRLMEQARNPAFAASAAPAEAGTPTAPAAPAQRVGP